MTFEGQYLTYAEYQALGGSAIGEMPFNILEFEARRKIDIDTFNRVKNGGTIPQEVKLCEYALINSLQSYINSLNSITSSGGVSSENTDGYSVTYISSTQISQLIEGKIDVLQDLISTYLFGVIVNNEHLLYLGV